VGSPDRVFVTDSGIETVLIFDYKQDLPQFASFVCLENTKGREALDEYFNGHGKVASDKKIGGLILDTATWRLSKDWAQKVAEEQGRDQVYTDEKIIELNKTAVE